MENEVKRIWAMQGISEGVKVWEETVIIPTYPTGEADKNPMFFERRVYQGSSGKVYPLPFIDSVATEKEDRTYNAIHLENEFIYVMVLPEFGGRIHIAYDKTNGYDFIYRQNVIKPALVGLCGPWISGGIEFNWPQHHRPSTFMPCEHFIEQHEDGSQTLWLSEHEPMNRMKGMHGVHLDPGSSCLEVRARLYNRTPYVQTFLWWANVAARVHEEFESFFPPDVHHVADHAKRAMSTFPLCDDHYYGVDYGTRGREGVPEDEQPSNFKPQGDYAANDLARYANIPVPTSYMVLASEYDFFGGYDHKAKAGFVHVANRHIAPGKKQWTWGNHDFGYAWDRNLTDEDGPYVELMAGVYTDNQPDFSFLAPYETRTFTQTWYPIQGIGAAQNATRDAAISLTVAKGKASVGVSTTRVFKDAKIELWQGQEKVWDETADLAPSKPFLGEASVTGQVAVRVLDATDSEIASYQPKPNAKTQPTEPATEPPLPADVTTNEELYTVGLHLEQYRHATRAPEPYWEEAIKRDPYDSRCQNALGRWRLRRGEFERAEQHFVHAIQAITRRNPNPYDGEPYYNLGLVLEFQGRYPEAEAAFWKASWNYAWKAAAQFNLARLLVRRKDLKSAEECLRESLQGLGQHNEARCLLATILRLQNRTKEATYIILDVLNHDPLVHWALYEAAELGDTSDRFKDAMRNDPQAYLDLALCFGKAGLFEEALGVLEDAHGLDYPMLDYAEAYYADLYSQAARAKSSRLTAGRANRDYCFPSRLEEMAILQAALNVESDDALAAYLLGNFYYDKRRYQDAIAQWDTATQLDPSEPTPWRNRGIAAFNVENDSAKAVECYEKARKADPDDARLVFEQDQLAKRIGTPPADRLKHIEERLDLIAKRDDLTLETCAMYNQTGRHDKALALLQGRVFTPWEGGEGVALGQHARTHRLLALKSTDANQTIELLSHALHAPQSLGEARHLLANQSDLWYLLGDALLKAGRDSEANPYFQRAADFGGDFQEMSVRSFSKMTYYRALAMRLLKRVEEADALITGLVTYAESLKTEPAKIDYFATSLPTMLLFNDDLQRRQGITADFLLAQALAYGQRMDEAKLALQGVLKQNPNHGAARDLMSELS